ncbi:neuropeptides capa receptor isoform X2 [Strongylocentrotus purpuratus]|uniref:G-protein coupled receptors family 1 profile domain-containing protein n=1 Tax=Strongylocentrotus purpuratus TaxID=7668 RepID=A0A7M7N1X3_STRPU|nr:neuropeptides capa receptor isoform X2 [Strongylocentrotus purpuratus]|eukprot:XP_011665374.1 PREDICTED: growth hormone secretagogue receptor type 1-like isoform X2 [Strongylocentrotus purpuratus]
MTMEGPDSQVMSYLPAEGPSHNGSDGFDYCQYSYERLKREVSHSDVQSVDSFFFNITRTCYLDNNLTCPAYMYDLSGDELIDHLSYIMPPSHYEYAFVIPFAVIILSLVFVGFFGNLLTIIVILRNRVLQSTSHYLVSLAASDMLLLVLTGPTEVLVELRYWPWTYTSFFCHARFFLIEFCLFTTVLHITAFTIERYVAICHPMKAKAFISTSRAIKFIIAIWILSFLISIPLALSYHLKEGCDGIEESTVCQTTDEMENRVNHFYVFSATFLFLLPMTLIIVLYSLIARVLFGVNIKVPMRRSSSTKGRCRVNGNLKAKEDKEDQVITMRKQVVKMLVVIAASFFICWFPFHLIRILPFFNLDEWPQPVQEIYYRGLYHFSIVLLYVSSAINPILYNVMSARFRRAFKQTILCREVGVPSSTCVRQTTTTTTVI